MLAAGRTLAILAAQQHCLGLNNCLDLNNCLGLNNYLGVNNCLGVNKSPLAFWKPKRARYGP